MTKQEIDETMARDLDTFLKKPHGQTVNEKLADDVFRLRMENARLRRELATTAAELDTLEAELSASIETEKALRAQLPTLHPMLTDPAFAGLPFTVTT